MSSSSSSKTFFYGAVCWDILLILVLIFDLFWLLFDALYSSQSVALYLDTIVPFYAHIHHNFYYYDAFIVGFFILDILLRWIIALYLQTYQKWFIFPFANWYDILGSFPSITFRFLRFLRLFPLFKKLNKHGFIQAKNWTVYRVFLHYYEVILDELSDRIIIKTLAETKKEIERDPSISYQLKKEVFAPRKQQLTTLIVQTIQDGIRLKYPILKPQLKEQIDDMIGHSIKNNESVRQLEKIPIVGKQLTKTIEDATSDIVFGVMDNILTDLSAEDKNSIIQLIVENMIDLILEYQNRTGQLLIREIIRDALDLIVQRTEAKK